jgi:hypothetical protein
MKIGTNGGRRTMVGVDNDEGGTDRLGEKRGREKERQERRRKKPTSI